MITVTCCVNVTAIRQLMLCYETAIQESRFRHNMELMH